MHSVCRLVCLNSFSGHESIANSQYNQRRICFCWDCKLFCHSSRRLIICAKTTRPVLLYASYFEQVSLSVQIGINAKRIDTRFLSMGNISLMLRSKYMRPSKISTATFPTTPNDMHTCRVLIFNIKGKIPHTLIHSFAVVRAFDVSRRSMRLLQRGQRQASLNRFVPAPVSNSHVLE